MQHIKMAVAAVGFTVASALGALAATVTVVNPPGVIDTSDTLGLPDGATFTDAPQQVAGSVLNIYKSPFGPADTTTKYWSVQKDGPYASPAILVFDVVHTSLSLLWGSVDTFNTLVFKKDGATVFTLLGSSLIPPATDSDGAAKVTISHVAFDEVVFLTSKNAFEFANVSAQVPVPAAGLLLLTALGGVAAVRRRKTA